MAKLKLDKEQKAEIEAGALLDQIDASLEPHALTDKKETKVLGCRTCKRPCIVTRFASAAKTACNNHRDRHAAIEVVHEIKSDLEPHVLTDKEETKTVPCRVCGRPCIVTLFASAPKVACLEHRKANLRPTKTTEFKDDGTGRMVATTSTHIVNEHDLAWSEWSLGQPWNFDRLYTDEEREIHKTAKAACVEAKAEIRANKRKIVEPKTKLAEVESLESRNVELEEVRRLNGEDQNRVARIAYIRGALAVGYRVEERDSKRFLTGREIDVAIPDDYLDVAGYHAAEKKIPVTA